ncbi:alpha/beta family hydrolase [Streptomyces sp. NPDC002306]
MPGYPVAGSEPRTALVVRHRPETVRAAVFTLHGGRPDSRQVSRPWHPEALRMRPVLRAAAEGLPLNHVLLGQVRYRYRGWNGGDPVEDAFAALSSLGVLSGDVPVVLVGHSMGARAALRAAAHPAVRGVLALAPWVPPGEPVHHLRGKSVVVLHGDRDRVTRAADSTDFVFRARDAGARSGVVLIRDGDHAMLRRSRTWHRLTAQVVGDLMRSDARFGGVAATSFAATVPLVLDQWNRRGAAPAVPR